jgi:mannobiose 2-epimerase
MKTTNTHLLLVESLTALLEASGDHVVRRRLQELHRLFLTRIVDAAGYVRPALGADWSLPAGPSETSYGHDLEAAWLLGRSAVALGGDHGDPLERAMLALVDRSLRFGHDLDRGGFYHQGPATGPATVRTKTWWVQAEALVALLAAWKLSGESRYFAAFESTAEFVFEKFVDHEHGEWFELLDEDGRVRSAVKASPWKDPYHQARACIEVARRLNEAANVD